MSILIRGMEMPTSCATCKLFGEYGCPLIGTVTYALTRGKRHKDCPLVSVPPHGRLINADALGITDFEIVMCNGDYKELAKMILEKIENAPTVIPASEEA